MMYQFTDQLSIENFDAFARNNKYNSFFQTSAWSEVKDNWHPIYVGMYQEKQLVGVCLVLKREIVLGYSILYAPRGPLIDYENKEAIVAMFSYLEKLAKEEKAFKVIVDPNIKCSSDIMIDVLKGKEPEKDDVLINALKDNTNFIHQGFTKKITDTIQPRFEAVVYFDDWYHDSFSKTRGYRNYQQATKGQVKFREITLDEIEVFEDIMSKTEEYKDINLRDASYYTKLKEAFKDDCFIGVSYLDVKKEIKLINDRIADFEMRLANPQLGARKRKEYENQLSQFVKDKKELASITTSEDGLVYLAGGLSLKSSDKAELLYAGMDRNFSKYNGSDVVYIHMLDWAEQNNCNMLSFGGVQGGLENGLTKYKLTFSPKMDEFIGEFIYIEKPIINKLFDLAYKIRSKFIDPE